MLKKEQMQNMRVYIL